MQDVIDEGKELGNFLWEMIKHTKDILMYKVSKKNEIYSEEEIKQIAEISEKVSKEELINIIYKLSELENKMKWSSQKTIIFETEIIKLCVKQETLGLEERIKKLEKAVIDGKIEVTQKTTKEQVIEPKIQTVPNIVSVASSSVPKKEIKEEKQQYTPPSNLANGNIISNWQNVLGDLKKQGKVMLYANLINTDAVEINDMTVGIRFNNGLTAFRKDLLQKPENMNILIKAVSMVCGKTMQIRLEDAGGVKESVKQVKEQVIKKEIQINEETEEDILSSLDIPINFIEE